jgi:glycosyltransferase involved in cell wall biosynthesis
VIAQLLVARHNEPEGLVGRLLGSVPTDDVEAIIADDGSDEPLPSSFLSRWPFPVRYEMLPHRNLSATRNALLDMSDGDVLMFCDADDSFHGEVLPSSVRKMGGADMLTSALLQEGTDGRLFVRHCDPYFCQGKLFSRSFLMGEQIRWDESFPHSGDNYFLWQAIELAGTHVYDARPMYVWRYNPGSVCRRDPHHFRDSQHLHLRSHRLLSANFAGRGREDLARKYAAKLFCEGYAMTRQGWWDPSARYALDVADELRQGLGLRDGALAYDGLEDMLAATCRGRDLMGGFETWLGSLS